ncbi:26232_t:CDS:2 [Gigaspora margarita]|uniref:26232_t:CDS:1 n=1 Tax=Gigaspora margarita TaxID=4874 RepID=A0ABM8VVB1_GIGMA|nr:26232_t:CDS:2 [Gigaspora margarita]
MNEILIYLLVILGILLVPLLSILLNYYFERKKLAAETEKLQLQNKITKDISYDQLKTESKHKDIKGKIEILSRLNKLEAEIKNKENITASDQKKLESLEMIKKEFKETFAKEAKEEPKLIEEERKETGKEIKKVGSAKINLKNKKPKNRGIVLLNSIQKKSDSTSQSHPKLNSKKPNPPSVLFPPKPDNNKPTNNEFPAPPPLAPSDNPSAPNPSNSPAPNQPNPPVVNPKKILAQKIKTDLANDLERIKNNEKPLLRLAKQGEKETILFFPIEHPGLTNIFAGKHNDTQDNSKIGNYYLIEGLQSIPTEPHFLLDFQDYPCKYPKLGDKITITPYNQ